MTGPIEFDPNTRVPYIEDATDDPFDTVRLWIDDVYGDPALAALASIKEERDGWKARAEAAEGELKR